jgi:sulfoxide reductase heme-binding subunit YedZ
LAATSFNRAIKAMGAKRWQMLHKLIYVIAGLGLLHFFWMRAGKNNFAEVFVYVAIIGVLLAWRVWNFASKRSKARQPAAGVARGGEKPLRTR